MAAVSIPTFIDDSNEYVSEKAFTTEEKSSWKHYRSKFVMFQAIFASVIFSIKGVSLDIIDAVKKMLKCGTDKLGFTMYQCPSCGQYKKVPFTCHTRICCSCGNLYNMQRANSIAEKMFDVKHRHIVFTIPDALRPYFKITGVSLIFFLKLLMKPFMMPSTRSVRN